jgi:hypothetical protein
VQCLGMPSKTMLPTPHQHLHINNISHLSTIAVQTSLPDRMNNMKNINNII